MDRLIKVISHPLNGYLNNSKLCNQMKHIAINKWKQITHWLNNSSSKINKIYNQLFLVLTVKITSFTLLQVEDQLVAKRGLAQQADEIKSNSE
jgi:hypothetical protein